MIYQDYDYEAAGGVKAATNARNEQTGNRIILAFLGLDEDCYYIEALPDKAGMIRAGREASGDFYASFDPAIGESYCVRDCSCIDDALSELEGVLLGLDQPPQWLSPQTLAL
jgi:hypothetical protein